MADVTVYGIADVSMDFTDNGDIVGTSGVKTHKVSSNASRLGFKGSEDLGGGLKAIWQIENQVNIDNSAVNGQGGTASGILGNRNTFAGLAGDAWGSLTLGRNDTPYKSATRGLDVFLDHIADNRNLMGTGNLAFDARNTDTARYDSADLSGFKLSAAYVAGAEANTVSTANTKGKIVSLAGTYATGPFFGALAWEKHTFGSVASGGMTVTATPTLTDEKAWKIGGGYKVDQFAVNAVYERTKDSLGSTAGGMGHKAFLVGGVFNATANDAIKLSFTKAKDLRDGSLANSGARQWALGVDHSLSKRTTAYAMYTKLNNDSAAAYGLTAGANATGSTAAVGAGADPSAFSFGLKHTF